MSASSGDSADLLRSALVGAYGPYVARRLQEIAPGGPDASAAIEAGTEWLADSLERLLGTPFAEQRRSPLEVFQEAMRFPTEVLAAAGVPEPDRDPVARSALPGDRYDLAPASSQELGEDVLGAHLAWGAAKAAALARPQVGLLGVDLMDRARIEEAVDAAGWRLTVWRDLSAIPDPEPSPPVVFVDLTHPNADEAIRSLSGRGARVVGYGPHVDDLALARARTLGAVDALPRSRFFRVLGDWLPPVL